MVGSNDTRNAGSRKRNIRLERVIDFYDGPFGLSSLTLSISEQRAKWVEQCIKRFRRLECTHNRLYNDWIFDKISPVHYKSLAAMR